MKLLQLIIKKIGQTGLPAEIDGYQYTKGYAFNHMNFTALFISLLRLFYIIQITNTESPVLTIVINSFPTICCLLMFCFMVKQWYKFTVYFSFAVFPALLFFIAYYMNDRGVITFFVPYMIYPFFFLNNKLKITVSFVISALFFLASFFVDFFQGYSFPIASHNLMLESISIVGGMTLTFITLYSIKFQVWHYEKKVVLQKKELERKNKEIKKEQEKLKESNIIKDKLFSIISHDLRIPIQGLQLLLNNTNNVEESMEKISENLPELKAELKKTMQLFDELLKWSKLQITNKQQLNEEEINVLELAKEMKKSFHSQTHQKEIEICINIEEPYIYSDKNSIEIVLRNLLYNAIKFTQPKGSIHVTCKQEKNNYVLQIKDNGIGIDEASMKKIMRADFYSSVGTNNERGTGLGLIICKDVIEKCNGKLSIASKPEKGTEVSIIIPINTSFKGIRQKNSNYVYQDNAIVY